MHGHILLDKTFPYSVLKDWTSLLLDKTFPYSVLKDWTSLLLDKTFPYKGKVFFSNASLVTIAEN